MKRLADGLVRGTLVLAVLAMAALFVIRFLTLPDGGGPMRIAHAGGGIDGATYTNSLAALDANHAMGFRQFEIDFLKTRDDAIICSHDWEPFDGKKLSLEDFNRLRGELAYPPCTLDEVLAWFAAHPDSVLISDTKSDTLEIVRSLAERLPDQLIAQIYDFEHVCELDELGVERAILTLYRLPRTYRRLISGLRNSCASSGRLEAVTMDTGRVWRGHALVTKLLTGLPVYAHTVNDCGTVRRLYLLGADDFYTDFLPAGPCGFFGSGEDGG